MTDPDRLEEVITAYETTLYRAALAVLGDAHEAEDAVQDTFLRALQAWPKFRGESTVETWLVRIAVNTCKDSGSQSLASNVSLAGKIMVTVTALPLYSDILKTVLSLAGN